MQKYTLLFLSEQYNFVCLPILLPIHKPLWKEWDAAGPAEPHYLRAYIQLSQLGFCISCVQPVSSTLILPVNEYLLIPLMVCIMAPADKAQ